MKEETPSQGARNGPLNQLGQAVLEYILVLLITVSIILGILYQFNDAFKSFLDTYFGDYIACLLETGELPALGGDGPSTGECVVPPMDLAGGRNLDQAGGGQGGAGETNGDGDGGDDLGPEDKGRGGSGRGGRPRQFTPSGASPNAEARAGGGGRPASIRKRVNSTNTQAGAPSTDSDSSSQRSLGRSSRPTRKRIIYLGGDYLSPQAQKEKERSVVRSLKPPPEGRGIQNLRQPQFDLDVPKRQLASSKNEGVSLGFGALIKFLLIGALLIALLVFLGGQAMQIKKGWQKGE